MYAHSELALVLGLRTQTAALTLFRATPRFTYRGRGAVSLLYTPVTPLSLDVSHYNIVSVQLIRPSTHPTSNLLSNASSSRKELNRLLRRRSCTHRRPCHGQYQEGLHQQHQAAQELLRQRAGLPRHCTACSRGRHHRLLRLAGGHEVQGQARRSVDHAHLQERAALVPWRTQAVPRPAHRPRA